MNRKSLLILGLIASLGIICSGDISGQTAAAKKAEPCSDITVIGSQWNSTLSAKIQRQILQSLASDILIEAKASGIFLSEPNFSLKSVQLQVLEIVPPLAGHKLYIVRWGRADFVVDAPIWIVEINSHGARNLILPTAGFGGTSVTGWGVQVLSKPGVPYPELLFTAKAFLNPSGPAVASPDCEAKVGDVYKSVACPANCFENLQHGHNQYPTDGFLKSDF
jgi:hypothetical protein